MKLGPGKLYFNDNFIGHVDGILLKDEVSFFNLDRVTRGSVTIKLNTQEYTFENLPYIWKTLRRQRAIDRQRRGGKFYRKHSHRTMRGK
jgi:hypothetical protein